MRNKLYVGAVLVPAVLLTWGAIHFALGDNTIFALILAGLALALGFAAVRIGKAESFAPTPKAPHNSALSANVKRWLKVQGDEAAEPKPSTAASQIRRQ